MRAIVVHEGGGPDVLELEEVPDPAASNGHVLVRVEAAAVNHFDITQRIAPEMTGATPPFTRGLDAAGTRVDTRERVLVKGAPGAYAELKSRAVALSRLQHSGSACRKLDSLSPRNRAAIKELCEIEERILKAR